MYKHEMLDEKYEILSVKLFFLFYACRLTYHVYGLCAKIDLINFFNL